MNKLLPGVEEVDAVVAELELQAALETFATWQQKQSDARIGFWVVLLSSLALWGGILLAMYWGMR